MPGDIAIYINIHSYQVLFFKKFDDVAQNVMTYNVFL